VVAARLKFVSAHLIRPTFHRLIRPPYPKNIVPRLLRGEEIREGLRKLDGWKVRGKFLVKVFDFEEFAEGIRFVDSVAQAADRLEHHPDISIRYTRVTLSLQTHSEGGVTLWDLQLARAIDRLGEATKAPVKKSGDSG